MTTSRQPDRPNILFILMDDMGWKDPGFMGSDFFETPALDRLAGQGIVFTSAYANAPNCAPSRACIMSGQYTPRHGVYTVGSSERGPSAQRKLVPTLNTITLAQDHSTIAECLKRAGYATFHGGKWHLGSGDTGPEARGFDVNVGGCHAGSPPGGYFAPWTAPNLENAPEGAHLCDYVTDAAIRFIEEHRTNPFFAYVSYYDVHGPLQGKPDLVQKYTDKRAANERRGCETLHNEPVYGAMVENSDMNIGRLLDTLDRLGIAESTLVVFFSDNGGSGRATTMRPLRGCKGMLYEGGVREPMIVRWPGTVPAGQTCDVPVIGTDFFPTFLEAAGAPLPDRHVLDGESLMSLVGGGAPPQRDALYWHVPVYLEGISRGFENDSRDGIWRTTPCSVVRKGDWKLIEYFEDGGLELYNVADDPGERKNVSEQMPARTDELQRSLKAWQRAVRAPLPTTPNPEYEA